MTAAGRAAVRAAFAGWVVGLLYGLSNLSIIKGSSGPDAVGFGQYIVENGLSFTHFQLLVPSLMKLLVLFLFVIQAGGSMVEALHTMAPYRLTRGKGRIRLYCVQALYLAAISIAYCSLYALGLILVLAFAGGYSVSAGDWKVICAALCAHLIPGTLFTILWANFLACRIGRANACLCVICACTILLFALPASEEYHRIAAINPMMHLSPSWKEWFETGDGMDYRAHSLIYWCILLCVTLAVQAILFRRADIL